MEQASAPLAVFQRWRKEEGVVCFLSPCFLSLLFAGRRRVPSIPSGSTMDLILPFHPPSTETSLLM